MPAVGSHVSKLVAHVAEYRAVCSRSFFFALVFSYVLLAVVVVVPARSAP